MICNACFTLGQRLLPLVGSAAAVLIVSTPLQAQAFNEPADPADIGTPLRLIGDGDPFPEGPVQSTAAALTLSPDGKFVGRVRTSFLDFSTFETVETDRFFGGDPASPGVLLAEGAGTTSTTALGLGRLNVLNQLGYSAKVDAGTQFDPDGIFLDDLLLAREGLAVPTAGLTVPGSTFDTGPEGLQFIDIAGDGDVSYLGEYETALTGVVNAPGSGLDGLVGGLVNQGLFQYDAQTGTTSTLFQTGDVIFDPNGASYVVGSSEVETSSTAGGIDVERVGSAEVSDNGLNYAATFDVNPLSNVLGVDGNTLALAVNGSFVTLTDGTTIREEQPAPMSIGGNGTTATIESINTFDINDNADFAVALQLGDPDLNISEDPDALSVLILNGESVFDTSNDRTQLIENVNLNNQGDVAFTLGEAIYLNGAVVLEPGDALSDGTLFDLTGGIALSDRDASDVVSVALVGRTANGGPRAYYVFDVQLPVIPEPGSALLLGASTLGLIMRRRREIA